MGFELKLSQGHSIPIQETGSGKFFETDPQQKEAVPQQKEADPQQNVADPQQNEADPQHQSFTYKIPLECSYSSHSVL